MPVSEVEYARAEDGTHVAYRVLAADASCNPGTDIVMVAGGLIPMEVFEDDPGFARLLEGLCSLGRVVVFDRRGIGLSDPIVDWERPTLDQWADDLAAVVEASGAREAAVFAWDGFGVATRFAARHADRLRLLVLYQPLALSDDRWDVWITEWHREASENLGGRKGSSLIGSLHRARRTLRFATGTRGPGKLERARRRQLGSGTPCSARDRTISSSAKSVPH